MTRNVGSTRKTPVSSANRRRVTRGSVVDSCKSTWLAHFGRCDSSFFFDSVRDRCWAASFRSDFVLIANRLWNRNHNAKSVFRRCGWSPLARRAYSYPTVSLSAAQTAAIAGVERACSRRDYSCSVQVNAHTSRPVEKGGNWWGGSKETAAKERLIGEDATSSNHCMVAGDANSSSALRDASKIAP